MPALPSSVRPENNRPPAGQPQGVAPTAMIMALPDVVHRYKTLTTKRYTEAVKHTGWKPFPGRLWQRNYWDHIVRNERELHRIRAYIINNPAKWESDRLYGPPSIPYGPGTRVRICRGGLDGMNHLFIAPRAAISL